MVVVIFHYAFCPLFSFWPCQQQEVVFRPGLKSNNLLLYERNWCFDFRQRGWSGWGLLGGVLDTLVSTSPNALKLLTLANPNKTKESLLMRVSGWLAHCLIFRSEIKIFWTKSRLKSIICSYMCIFICDWHLVLGGMVLSPISPKPKSEKEKKERNCMDLNKKLSISFVHVKKTTPMLGNKCMSTSQPTKLSITFVHTQNNTHVGQKDHTNISTHHEERSIQSHTNPHHPMHDEQINKLMDDWIDMFNPPHIA